MRLRDLLQGAELFGGAPLPEMEISGLCADSRQAGRGDLFFAVPGAHVDGNSFITAAAERGAIAAVSDRAPEEPYPIPVVAVKDLPDAMALAASRFFSQPSISLKTIGITGTNGKTTTAYFLESILALHSLKPGVIGTINYRVNGQVIAPAINTTPYSIYLERLLAQMRDAGAKAVAMEVSSHSLSLKRVQGIYFDAAIFLNLYRDHLDFHKTQDAYFEAKMKLFEMLGRTNPKKKRFAFINGDDPRARQVQDLLEPSVQAHTFGLGEGCLWRATGIQDSLDGVSFTLNAPEHPPVAVHLRLCGRYNVYNALAAISCLSAMGLPLETVVRGAERLESVPGRLEAVRLGQEFHVFVDFAHTESALSAVIDNLAAFPHGKIYTVFGCGGERDRGKRGPMGVAVCSRCDHAFITADNPRREPLDQIMGDIEAGLKEKGLSNYTVIPDRREAVFAALKAAGKGDIVILAGKGHERVQILNTGSVSYSDRETAESVLREILGI